MCRQSYDIKEIFCKYFNKKPNHTNYGRHVLPPKNLLCSNCKAYMWIDEKTEGSKKSPKFSMCCAKGQFILPKINKLPQLIFDLLTKSGQLNAHFRENIRAFNTAFAFTSFNANVINQYYYIILTIKLTSYF
jgi:hypothetical protein